MPDDLGREQKMQCNESRICPQKMKIKGKELSMPDPWLRVLEWRLQGESLKNGSKFQFPYDLQSDLVIVIRKNRELEKARFKSNFNQSLSDPARFASKTFQLT